MWVFIVHLVEVHLVEVDYLLILLLANLDGRAGLYCRVSRLLLKMDALLKTREACLI